jgi:nitrite reductase/ring-hydroxylating ferredoxin subunit
MSRTLCRLDDIGEGAAKGFDLSEGDNRRFVFVVRSGGKLYGYVNACPHLGTPLDLVPDRFFTRDGTQLLCSLHGARFEVTTGKCTFGPCEGDRLEPFAIRLEHDVVMVDE